MMLLGTWFGALGICDLIAGGKPTNRKALLASAVAAVTAAATLMLAEYPIATTAGFALIVLIASLAWTLGRMGLKPPGATEDVSEHSLSSGSRAGILLAGMVLGTAAVAATAGAWDRGPANRLRDWAYELPFDVQGNSYGRLVLLVGSGLFLCATANVLVRIVLTSLGDPIEAGEDRLKGGRFIGPMERLLIFGFAASGDITAAAVVVSAKSLLRFPELSAATKDSGTAAKVDAVTEYFLVGSLASWMIAFVPVIFL